MEYYCAKRDLETFPRQDLQRLANYFQIQASNINDLCWLLALSILNQRAEMSPEKEIGEEIGKEIVGKECKLYQKSFEPCKVRLNPKTYCKANAEAKRIINLYHQLGDKWWGKRCNSKMTAKEIDNAIEDLQTVYNLRCKYTQKYCQGNLDRGHLQALKKIQHHLERCLKVKCNGSGVKIKLTEK